MSIEQEPQSTEQKVENTNAIAVDIDGISIPNVPIEIAKQIIEKRQASKKEVKDLQDKVAKAEMEAKSINEKAKLLELMKTQDIQAVEETVSAKYKEKISQYESKIFKGEIKSLLASNGVLPTAIDDAATLALQGVQVSLNADKVMIGDKDADTYIKEFIAVRPHLQSVKQSVTRQPTTTKSVPKADSGFNKFANSLFNK